MATFDAHKNFAISTVAVAPSSPTGGTSLSVFAGDGTKFPAVPFNAVIWPVNTQPVTANAEIVRVTNISGDVFTITRNAEVGGTTRSVVVGDQIGDNITAKLFTDIESLFPVGAVVGTTDNQVLTNKTLTAPAISATVLSGTATGTYTLAGTPTISSPTITTPAISAPALSGTATGTYTLGGTPTITAPIISGDITGTYALKGTPSVWNVITSAVSGTVNNWNPGLIGNTLIRLSNPSAATITGLVGGYNGQTVRIISNSIFQADFSYNSGSSSVGNKFVNWIASGPTSIISSSGNGYIEYQYDGSSWRLTGHMQGNTIPYTPSWAAGGSAPSLGNATLVGNYILTGTRVTFDIKQVMGSTTTFGTGNYAWTIPFGTVAGSGVCIDAAWSCQDVSAGGIVFAGSASVSLFTPGSITGYYTNASAAPSLMGATGPITFAVGDIIYLNGAYWTA